MVGAILVEADSGKLPASSPSKSWGNRSSWEELSGLSQCPPQLTISCKRFQDANICLLHSLHSPFAKNLMEYFSYLKTIRERDLKEKK